MIMRSPALSRLQRPRLENKSCSRTSIPMVHCRGRRGNRLRYPASCSSWLVMFCLFPTCGHTRYLGLPCVCLRTQPLRFDSHYLLWPCRTLVVEICCSHDLLYVLPAVACCLLLVVLLCLCECRSLIWRKPWGLLLKCMLRPNSGIEGWLLLLAAGAIS